MAECPLLERTPAMTTQFNLSIFTGGTVWLHNVRSGIRKIGPKGGCQLIMPRGRGGCISYDGRMKGEEGQEAVHVRMRLARSCLAKPIVRPNASHGELKSCRLVHSSLARNCRLLPQTGERDQVMEASCTSRQMSPPGVCFLEPS